MSWSMSVCQFGNQCRIAQTHFIYRHNNEQYRSCSFDDICKGQSLICRPNDICYVQCSAKSSCSAGTTVYGNGATDVKVACLAQDACIDGGDIYCGSGDCFLTCQDSTSCIKLGTVHTTNTLDGVTTAARSFGCDGFCPWNLPKSYSLSPTPSPTSIPTTSPTRTPSKSPSNAPSNQPTPNTATPTLAPTLNPTIHPTDSPSMPTQPPSTTISPTAFPTYFPSSFPTSNPIPSGFEKGAYNQLCEITDIKACHVTTQSIGDYLGDLSCMQPYECCMCKSVQCGYLATMPCDTLRIGEFGVYGVEKVLVTGNKAIRASGASIECYGTSACRQSHIYGSYVESIHCDGPDSCKDATVIINEPKRGFSIECTGTSDIISTNQVQMKNCLCN